MASGDFLLAGSKPADRSSLAIHNEQTATDEVMLDTSRQRHNKGSDEWNDL